MMKSKTFVEKVIDVAKNHKTLYVMGCFGAPLTGANVTRYCNNHEYNRRSERTPMIKAAADQSPPVYGFDCVCLIKGVLWGWAGNPARTYGGADYASNGVPDIGADSMIRVCSGVSTTDWADMVPGEAVWLEGHIGVYIGDGLAVECTPKWENKVQITAVANIGKKAGYNARSWTKHGRLPYVDYSDAAQAKPTQATAYTAGQNNEQTIFNFCREVLGLNTAGAVGVVTNVGAESSFKTSALGDNGTSFGICQWHASRFSNLKTWCEQNGKDYTALDGQLWYMKHELETSYSGVLSYIKGVENTAEGAYNAAYRWCLKFEIPADTAATSDRRGKIARDTYWPKYGGASTPAGTTSPASETVYVVKAGDTLSAIAAKYGTTYQAIAAHNGIENPDLIIVGQKIVIPGKNAGAVQPAAKTYTVKKGDSLWAIAASQLGNGARWPEIQKLNGLTSTTIYPGQILIIPV